MLGKRPPAPESQSDNIGRPLRRYLHPISALWLLNEFVSGASGAGTLVRCCVHIIRLAVLVLPHSLESSAAPALTVRTTTGCSSGPADEAFKSPPFLFWMISSSSQQRQP